MPGSLVEITIALHGEAAGRQWLEQLPRILDECAERWSLDLQPPFANLTYNYAAPAVRHDGTPVVVKAGFVPPDKELISEVAALFYWNGGGAVRLLESDLDQGLLLLERLVPGRPIGEIEDDEEAISIAATVLEQLWRAGAPRRDQPYSAAFPHTRDWGKGFARLRSHFGGTGPFPAELVERAEHLWSELEDSKAEPAVVLHGDLNFGNVLSAEREPWLAIDPKGIIGEPAYDTGIFLRDPVDRILASDHPDQFLARRIDQLADRLGFERSCIRDWGLAQAVLSAWWSIEDEGSGWEPAIWCAEALARIH
ncbi:MAG: aminoglycoside resistance protein [Chloroflexi bacterium]|nr:MAG: aminoglycoside resistance protein [Chloroflexota bacterium]